tara:strand:- start:309 stop:656 length:348 start_codon:yes stop_codon:yes gene_type:complete
MDYRYICCECYSTDCNQSLRDVADVVSYALGHWILKGGYTFGEYSLELGGKPKPSWFNPNWNGKEGSLYVCNKCTTIARDEFDQARQIHAEHRYNVENQFPDDPTGQDLDAHLGY